MSDVSNQDNFEVRIRVLEEHLKEIGEKLQSIIRLDIKPIEPMKLPKEKENETLNKTLYLESKITELEAENAKLKQELEKYKNLVRIIDRQTIPFTFDWRWLKHETIGDEDE